MGKILSLYGEGNTAEGAGIAAVIRVKWKGTVAGKAKINIFAFLFCTDCYIVVFHLGTFRVLIVCLKNFKICLGMSANGAHSGSSIANVDVTAV